MFSRELYFTHQVVSVDHERVEKYIHSTLSFIIMYFIIHIHYSFTIHSRRRASHKPAPHATLHELRLPSLSLLYNTKRSLLGGARMSEEKIDRSLVVLLERVARIIRIVREGQQQPKPAAST
jgi:hypothetical protein